MFLLLLYFAYVCVYVRINLEVLQVGRVKSVISDGVKEIWLSSEDTGAYGNFDCWPESFNIFH